MDFSQPFVLGAIGVVLAVFVVGVLVGRRKPGKTVVWSESPRDLVRNRDAGERIEDDPELRALVQSDRAIDAIKLVRERTGLGLRESKQVVDRLQSDLRRLHS